MTLKIDTEKLSNNIGIIFFSKHIESSCEFEVYWIKSYDSYYDKYDMHWLDQDFKYSKYECRISLVWVGNLNGLYENRVVGKTDNLEEFRNIAKEYIGKYLLLC